MFVHGVRSVRATGRLCLGLTVCTTARPDGTAGKERATLSQSLLQATSDVRASLRSFVTNTQTEQPFKCGMWRGDRDASCTPSGKGQRGVVAVYLIAGKRLLSKAPRRWTVFDWLTNDWLTNVSSIKMNFVARVFWAEHPYQFQPRLLKSGRRCQRTVGQCASSCLSPNRRD